MLHSPMSFIAWPLESPPLCCCPSPSPGRSRALRPRDASVLSWTTFPFGALQSCIAAGTVPIQTRIAIESGATKEVGGESVHVGPLPHVLRSAINLKWITTIRFGRSLREGGATRRGIDVTNVNKRDRSLEGRRYMAMVKKNIWGIKTKKYLF